MSFALMKTPLQLAIVAALLCGCANNAQTGALAGGAMGCAMGLLLDHGNKNRVAKCAEGGVPLAAAGYYVGRQRDLALAQRAAEQIRGSQPPGVVAVQMRTTNVAVPEADRAALHNASTIESLDTMIVSVPQPQVQRMDPKVVDSLGRVGKFVSDAQSNLRVTVSTQSRKDYDFMVASMQRGYSTPQPPQKVSYQYRPLTRGTQATVEVSPESA